MITYLKTRQFIESALTQNASENDKEKNNLALSHIHQAIDMSVDDRRVYISI